MEEVEQFDNISIQDLAEGLCVFYVVSACSSTLAIDQLKSR